MGRYTEYYKARSKVVEIVREDLVGPVTEDEVINELPTSYYIMGKLYPNTKENIEHDDIGTSADLEALDMDNALSATNVRDPRSMGVTFTVLPGIDYVNVRISFAVYKPFGYEDAKEKQLDISRYQNEIDEMDEKEKSRLLFWKREKLERSTTLVDTTKRLILRL